MSFVEQLQKLTVNGECCISSCHYCVASAEVESGLTMIETRISGLQLREIDCQRHFAVIEYCEVSLQYF